MEKRVRGILVMIAAACLFIWLGTLGAGCAHREAEPFDESAYKRELIRKHHERMAEERPDMP
jgi:hypothetical protein